MPVSLNIIFRSLPLHKCWFSSVLFFHPLNIRIVKSMVLVLKWEGKEIDIQIWRMLSAWYSLMFKDIWKLILRLCVLLFRHLMYEKSRIHEVYFSTAIFKRGNCSRTVLSELIEKKEKWRISLCVRGEAVISKSAFFLVGVNKNFSAFACRFSCFHCCFCNSLEFCWVCEEEQGLSPTTVIQHRSGRRWSSPFQPWVQSAP